MTLEITDRDDFKDKFAHLMAANMNMISAGTEPSKELSSIMIDEFLYQFAVATPATAPRITAGFIVTVRPSGAVPFDFKNSIYEFKSEAQLAVSNFISNKGYGRTSDYDIKEVTYLG